MNAGMEACKRMAPKYVSLRVVLIPAGCLPGPISSTPSPAPVSVPGGTYLKKVVPFAGQNLALPPPLEEPLELHEEQQEVVLELLRFLHQHVLLLAPEFLLQPPLEAQTLQLKLPPQERPLLVLLQLRGGQEREQPQLSSGALPHPIPGV